MQLTARHNTLPRQPTANASIVMDHFGITFETQPHTIAENFDLPIQPGDVVLFTGPSGSGKSTLLKTAATQLQSNPLPSQTPLAAASGVPLALLNIDGLNLGQNLLVDALNLPLQSTLQLLTACGLGEARLLLRTPSELSDGQRYRFRLALALSKNPTWLLADEFTATLDRALAKVIAFNLRRQAEKTNTGLLLATTHEDLAEDLQPTLHVRCSLDAPPQLTAACGVAPPPAQKKSANCRSSPTSKSRTAPRKTGRTSLAGITAPTTSESSAS